MPPLPPTTKTETSTDETISTNANSPETSSLQPIVCVPLLVTSQEEIPSRSGVVSSVLNSTFVPSRHPSTLYPKWNPMSWQLGLAWRALVGKLGLELWDTNGAAEGPMDGQPLGL